MKTRLALLLTFVFVLAGLQVPAATADVVEPSTSYADLSFDVGSADSAAPATQTVEVGSTATMPPEPTKAGWVFTGWSLDAEGSQPFYFFFPITEDLTIHAIFEPEAAPTLDGPSPLVLRIGQPSTWFPRMTGSPAPRLTVTEGVLPQGLSLEPLEGRISGSVEDTDLIGDHQVTLTASNGVGSSPSLELTITIKRALTRVQVDGNFYSIDEDTGEVTFDYRPGSAPRVVIIPATIPTPSGDRPVTAIGAAPYPDAGPLESLTLPDSVTTIGESAFSYSRLSSLHLGTGLRTIGPGAFSDTLLTQVDLPPSLSEIGDTAFARNGLTDVTIPARVTSIGAGAFSGNPLTTVRFTGPAPVVAEGAFGDGDPVLRFPSRFGADQVEDGYTTPTWAGYRAVPDDAVPPLMPTITGRVREGHTLTAVTGPDVPAGSTLTYRWRNNGVAITGATGRSFRPGAAQTGKAMSVTVTATTDGLPPRAETSAKTPLVTSPRVRMMLSTRAVGKGRPLTVIATGFRGGQKVVVWLGGDARYTGRADSRGIVERTVTFASDIAPGTRRVRVSGYDGSGKRQVTGFTTVRYR